MTPLVVVPPFELQPLTDSLSGAHPKGVRYTSHQYNSHHCRRQTIFL